jgi:hypothetical protein
MATMLGNVYAALVEAGASHETAQKAAEEVATYDARFARIEGDMLVLKWMSGTTLALVVAVLLKLFVH